MRSFLDSLFREQGPAGRTPRTRPETLRRRTLANNSKLILLANGLGAPVALYMLLHDALMPFVLLTIGLASGVLTLALQRHGQYERAAFGQVYATLVVGLLLTIVDPQMIDFGLAIALLAPVLASLLTRTPAKKRTWILLLIVVAVAALPAMGIELWPELNRPEYGLISAVAFVVTVVLVGMTASRMSAAFAVYENSQVNAYRHLVENVQDAVMRFAPDGSVLFTSKSAEKLFGCPRYQLAGNGLLERIHVLDRPAYLTAFAEANQDGKAHTVEIRMRRDDPAEPARVPHFAWIEVALAPVVDPSAVGPRNEVVALLRDVSERHAHEAEMREARQLAEDTSNAKSRFLATIGHELRTPLNAIVGFSEMMTSGVVGELSPAHREYAEIIHKSGGHLLDLVKMLLDMSRLEAGKFEIQLDNFDPGGLLEPCFAMLETMAKEREVTLVVDAPTLLPTIAADERACRQILLNLLSNAIKFSHDKGVVTVSMKRQGAMLNLSVTDRGIGMDREAISRIGEPFFQVQDGLARRYEGTGLGLSIVKGLAELHDGTLRAMSSPGEGTTVTVLLPINGPATKKPDTHEVTPLREPAKVATTIPWPSEKRRVL